MPLDKDSKLRCTHTHRHTHTHTPSALKPGLRQPKSQHMLDHPRKGCGRLTFLLTQQPRGSPRKGYHLIYKAGLRFVVRLADAHGLVLSLHHESFAPQATWKTGSSSWAV